MAAKTRFKSRRLSDSVMFSIIMVAMHTYIRFSKSTGSLTFKLAVPLAIIFGLLAACDHSSESLIVYSGKGLKYPMEEIKSNFEKREGVQLLINYAGSQTLLDTIRKTHKGDVYIPGASTYIKEAGELVVHSDTVASHIPIFAINNKKSSSLQSYADLLKPGVKIAIGNKDMAAMGAVPA